MIEAWAKKQKETESGESEAVAHSASNPRLLSASVLHNSLDSRSGQLIFRNCRTSFLSPADARGDDSSGRQWSRVIDQREHDRLIRRRRDLLCRLHEEVANGLNRDRVRRN